MLLRPALVLLLPRFDEDVEVEEGKDSDKLLLAISGVVAEEGFG